MMEAQQHQHEKLNMNNSTHAYQNSVLSNSGVNPQGKRGTNMSAINRLKEKTSKLVQITYNNNTNIS